MTSDQKIIFPTGYSPGIESSSTGNGVSNPPDMHALVSDSASKKERAAPPDVCIRPVMSLASYKQLILKKPKKIDQMVQKHTPTHL